MMNLKYLTICLFASMLLGCGCAAALSFSGENVQLTGNQTRDIIWNESNFGGFCYNLSDGVCIGTEALTIRAGALEGPDIDRLIDVGNLTYTTAPIWQEYELHKNLGLTVKSDRYEGDSGYWQEFWMGERYVAVGGNSSKLAKPLVEFNDTDTKSLAIGEEWGLGGGFTLTAMAIDTEGDKVLLRLCKDGKELYHAVIGTDRSDLQDRVYTYTEDVAGEDDVPVFSCYVSEIFRGTESDIIRVKYVFLLDNEIIQISTGEYYGNMQVRSITPEGVTLGNRDSLYPEQHPSTCQIMGNLSFETVNNDSAMEFYPHLIRDELPLLSGGGGFVSDHCGRYRWDLYENYTLGWNQVDVGGVKAWIVLCKDGVVVDERILTEEQIAPVDSDCRYSYSRNGAEIINATLKSAFRGSAANAVKLMNLNQYSDVDGTALIVDGSYLYKAGDPAGMAGELMGGYVLTVKDIDLQGDETWIELSTNGIVLKEDILRSGDLFEYGNDDGIESVDCIVEAVFRGCEANIVKLKNVTQYAGTGVRLIGNESMTYPDGVNDRPMVGLWTLGEGYSLSPRDIDINGNKVWLLLLKDGEVMKDAIIDSRRRDAGRWFKYYNVTGAPVFSTYVDVVFRGMEGNVVQLRHTTRYSEIDGSVFEWAKDILPVGITIVAPPTITGYNPGTYVSDSEGVAREFNIAIDQPSEVIWYIDGTVVKDTEKGVTSTSYTNDSAKTGYWNISVVASNANGTDMQTWWWTVNPGGYSTGNRIWEESMGDPYRWTAQSFTGFYYDIDDGLSTETLTITCIARSLDERSIVYETKTRSVNFDYSGWGRYDVIGFAAEMYFAGYNSDTDSDITDDTISLVSNKMLGKVLIDEDDKHMVSTGASLELEEGYAIRVVQINLQGDGVRIELLRDGNIVDAGIINNTPSTYTYTRDIGSADAVPVIAIRVDSVFAGTESDMLAIKGIFQISENYKSIKIGDMYDEMEITRTSSSGITMKNYDDISLDEGEIVDLMGDIKFLVADDSSTLRFALYKELTEPGTYDIRATVYGTTEKPTWTPMNFEGFYYDIDEDLGTEKLEVKEDGTSIGDGNLVYTTTVQPVRFDYSGWGLYNVIGFMAEKYFAGYNSGTANDITDDSISLVSNKMLSKVLIDSDKEHTVSTGASLKLEEDYELKIIQLDVSGDKAQIELVRNGRSVDTGIISNTPSTYTYTRDIGSVDDVPVIAIRVDSVSAGTEADLVTIKGVFQISENCRSVEAGDQYGEMEITSTSSTRIAMKNPDDIDLDEGGKTMIMDDIGFITSDGGDRYALFARRTVGTLNSLEIELPENPVVGEELLIRVTSLGDLVEGASVTVGWDYIGPTGPDGAIRFTPGAAGTFRVTASKRNYNSASVEMRIMGSSAATADAMIALQLAVSGGWDAGADASGDGRVTSLDALMIMQMAAGAETPLKIALVNNSIGVNDDIVVSFDKPISISTLSMSMIGPYGGMVSGLTICDDDVKDALFDPNNPLQSGEHSIHVKCRDLSDNLIEQEFVLTVVGESEPEPNTTTAIVINELMPNPIGTDRGNEITEMYNCGDAEVDIGGWVLKNEDGATYNIPAGTTIEPYGYYLTTKVQLDNGGGQVLLYLDGDVTDRSIAYTHSIEGISWQRRTDGLDTDSDGDWIERDSTFGVTG